MRRAVCDVLKHRTYCESRHLAEARCSSDTNRHDVEMIDTFMAEVSRGAVYGHFESKHAIFVAMCERVRWPLPVAEGGEQAELSRSPLAQLRYFGEHLLRRIAEDVPRHLRVT